MSAEVIAVTTGIIKTVTTDTATTGVTIDIVMTVAMIENIKTTEITIVRATTEDIEKSEQQLAFFVIFILRVISLCGDMRTNLRNTLCSAKSY